MILIPIVFTAVLLIANIYCFLNKRYLYLFIPCMIFLPEFYGIEFSDSLPLLTISRMMLITFFVYAYKNRRRNLGIKDIPFSQKQYILLLLYFILRIFTNLYYIKTYTQPLKTIFSIIVEQLLLLVSVHLLKPNKDEVLTLLKTIVYTASTIYFIGILETLTGIRPFDALYTVSREMLNDHYIRLGLLRATASFGLPGIYGNVCVLLFPFELYLFNYTRQKRYLIIIALNALAIIHSGSRSDILFFLFITFIYFIFKLISGKKRALLEYIKHSIFVIVLILMVITPLSLSSPYYKYFYVGSGKAVLNEFGCNFDLSEGAPKGIDGYGHNSGENGNGGINSRVTQLSGIKYAMNKNPIFGMGSGAQNRFQVFYYVKNKWAPYATFDIALVEVIYSEGLIGLLAHILLFIFLFGSLFHDKGIDFTNSNHLPNYLLLYIITYLICMLSTANQYNFLVLGIMLILTKLDNKQMY